MAARASLPPFRYRINALRVDGDASADPADYAGWPDDQPVGRELHAFLTGELRRSLLPGDQKGLMRWKLDQSRIVAWNPTVADLRRWSKRRYLVYQGCNAPPEGVTP